MVYNFRQKTVLETQVFNGKNLLLIFSLICSACIYVCVCVCSYLQQCHALGVIPIFFLSGVYSPRTFYWEQLAPLSACVLLDCTIFVWPLNQMGSCFPSCLVAFLCHSLRTQVLDTQSCSLNVEEALTVLLTLLCLCGDYHPCGDYGYNLLLFANRATAGPS